MTEAQLKASRENGKRSLGPRTPEGKKRSSLNAFRHGLTGQIVVHTLEDQEAFKEHCVGIREALHPVGALETDLAQAIAEDRWRLNRARALENSIFALGQSEHLPPDGSYSELDAALAQAQTWMDHAHQLHLLTIYENRIRRSAEKNTAELRTLQAERKAPIAKELPKPESAEFSPARQGGNQPPFSPARQGRDLGFVSSKIAPPQRPGRAVEPRNNRPEPTRPPTMENVYAITGYPRL